MKGCRDESTRLGADLHYSTHVKNIDHTNATVTLEDGRVFKAKHIVVTCGATTDQFY